MAKRPLNPADLTERITIQTSSVVADDQGGRATTWSTLATVWAAVRALSGREAIQARAVASEVNYEVVVRYRSDLTAKLRIAWVPSWSSGTASRPLEVHAVRPDRVTQTIALDCAEAA